MDKARGQEFFGFMLLSLGISTKFPPSFVHALFVVASNIHVCKSPWARALPPDP